MSDERPVELAMFHGGIIFRVQITLAQSHMIQSLLSGEAVAVPREPTGAMLDAGTRYDTYCDACKGVHFDPETSYRAMLAASPFAKEGKE